MNKNIQEQTGFTLIEIVIVVSILGILAAIIVPKVLLLSDDAKLSTFKTNLSHLRLAIRFYYYQHNDIYPGEKKKKGDGKDESSPDKAATAFLEQLTRYTNVLGKTDKEIDEDEGIIYGPYLKHSDMELPRNPYNGKNNVKCDVTTTDLTARDSDGTTGWKFYTKTGVFMANDGAHDSF